MSIESYVSLYYRQKKSNWQFLQNSGQAFFFYEKEKQLLSFIFENY